MSARASVGVAVDVAVLSLPDDRLSVLLVKLKRPPYEGRWGLPGGLIGARETVEQAAARELAEETGLIDFALEQVRTFSAPDRDPAGRCVSVAFLACVPAEQARLQTTGKYAGVGWFPVDDLGAARPLPFDHADIVAAAVARLRELCAYTNVTWSLMPRELTLGALMRAHEAIAGRALDPRNFRKRVLEADMLVETGGVRGGKHRPARLYRFRQRKTVMIGRGSQ
jgi:8-oxo-dGTP diphosphatase